MSLFGKCLSVVGLYFVLVDESKSGDKHVWCDCGSGCGSGSITPSTDKCADVAFAASTAPINTGFDKAYQKDLLGLWGGLKTALTGSLTEQPSRLQPLSSGNMKIRRSCVLHPGGVGRKSKYFCEPPVSSGDNNGDCNRKGNWNWKKNWN